MTSYIITYRQANADRYRHLMTILDWLNNSRIPDFEVVIVEQDIESKLEIANEYNFPVKHIFAKNAGLFNRSWGFNIAVKMTTSDVLFFADSDLFMASEYLFQAIGLIRSNEFDTVSPFASVHDLDKETTDSINVEDFDYNTQGELRTGSVFCSGVVGFSREGLNKINGWDERFEGWGGEDDIQTIKTKQLLKYTSLNGRIFHLYHARSINDGSDQHRNYASNFQLFKYYTNHPSRILVDMNFNRDIGNIDKYLKRSTRLAPVLEVAG